MSRRRSISTDISTDPKLADLAQYGPLPLLLYTWAIPHADDWGRLTGEARQFKLLVCPGLDCRVTEIDEALDQVASVGLWERYDVGGRKCIALPLDSFYKHQSYIPRKKRDEDKSQFPPPPSLANHRKTPQNTAEPSESPQIPLSPSPSLSPTPSPTPTERTTTRTTTTRAKVENKPPDPMSPTKLAWRTWHEQRFASLPPARWAAEIDEKIDKGMSHELVIAALDEAIQARADHPVSWANQRLGTWFAQGIRSPDELEAAQAKPGNGKPKGGKSSGKPVEERTERDWLEGYEGHFK